MDLMNQKRVLKRLLKSDLFLVGVRYFAAALFYYSIC